MVRKKKNKYPFSVDFENKNAQVVLGLFFLCISTILFLSFSSFLLNWKKDFDVLQLSTSELLLNPDVIVNNALGNVGASLGHFFIYKMFGFASFLIPFYLFILGLQTFTNQHIIKHKRLLVNSMFIGLWLTSFFGLYFSEANILSGLITNQAINFSFNFFEDESIVEFFYDEVYSDIDSLEDENETKDNAQIITEEKKDVEESSEEEIEQPNEKNIQKNNKTSVSLSNYALAVVAIVICFIGFNYLKLQNQVNSNFFGFGENFKIERSGIDEIDKRQ